MAPPPHALILPFPIQSHVIALLELSYCLLDRGLHVTFLNTEFNHNRLLAALSNDRTATSKSSQLPPGIRFAAISDGLEPAEDRNNIERVLERMLEVVPGFLEEFILKSEENFTCFVVDQTMAWALDVAARAGLRSVAFFPAAAAMLALIFSIPKLIADGVIDEEGEPKKNEIFQLSPEMHPMHPNQISWNCYNDKKKSKLLFNYHANNNQFIQKAELVLCNTFYEIEKPVFTYAPNILPIGPLFTGSRSDKTVGNFWEQDTECIEWLDKQQQHSVIYVAFGTFTTFNQYQFQELARGLELAGQPFLWVVRPGLTNFDDDNLINISSLIERLGERGRIVGWCPQQRVLAHPSIAVFISHCGWNSTLEGVRNGVPFLCWPYFRDQFFNQSYICDVWRVGLRITADQNNIYSSEEIRSKLLMLIDDKQIKERSLALKEMAYKSVENDGSSFNNFIRFVDLLKCV